MYRNVWSKSTSSSLSEIFTSYYQWSSFPWAHSCTDLPINCTLYTRSRAVKKCLFLFRSQGQWPYPHALGHASSSSHCRWAPAASLKAHCILTSIVLLKVQKIMYWVRKRSDLLVTLPCLWSWWSMYAAYMDILEQLVLQSLCVLVQCTVMSLDRQSFKT